MSELFHWHTFDVNAYMDKYRPEWREEILGVASAYAVRRVLHPSHSTSREAPTIQELPVLTVPGAVVDEKLPWLVGLYEDRFRTLGSQAMQRELVAGSNIDHRVTLNVQRRNNNHPERGRYEGHVDSNPVEGLLYVTSHLEGEGGALVVANNANARSVAEIEQDASRIYPQAGNLVYFDATSHPHYVNALEDPTALRVAVGMNYYTLDRGEDTRPATLDAYLAGEKVA